MKTKEQKTKATISRYKRLLKKEYEEYGSYNDGYGKRNLIFELYYLIDEPKDFKEYENWYLKIFPNDSHDTMQLICWALLLKRAGRHDEAKYLLAKGMLANLSAIPFINGMSIEEMKGIYDITVYMYCEWFNEDVIDKIRDEDLQWINMLYESIQFTKIRNRKIEIEKLLDETSEREKRKALVNEMHELVDTMS